MSDRDYAAISESMAVASGFTAPQAREGKAQEHWAENMLYELMRLKSFTICRAEELENVAKSHIGDKQLAGGGAGWQMAAAHGTVGGYGSRKGLDAGTAQQQMTSIRAEVEFIHTELLVDREKHQKGIMCLREEVSAMISQQVRQAVDHNLNAKTEELSSLLQSARDLVEKARIGGGSATVPASLEAVPKWRQALPDSFIVLPRLEENERGIAGLTARQENLEMKAKRWDGQVADGQELKRRLEGMMAEINSAQSQMASVIEALADPKRKRMPTVTLSKKSSQSSLAGDQDNSACRERIELADAMDKCSVSSSAWTASPEGLSIVNSAIAENRTNLSLLAESSALLNSRLASMDSRLCVVEKTMEAASISGSPVRVSMLAESSALMDSPPPLVTASSLWQNTAHMHSGGNRSSSTTPQPERPAWASLAVPCAGSITAGGQTECMTFNQAGVRTSSPSNPAPLPQRQRSLSELRQQEVRANSPANSELLRMRQPEVRASSPSNTEAGLPLRVRSPRPCPSEMVNLISPALSPEMRNRSLPRTNYAPRAGRHSPASQYRGIVQEAPRSARQSIPRGNSSQAGSPQAPMSPALQSRRPPGLQGPAHSAPIMHQQHWQYTPKMTSDRETGDHSKVVQALSSTMQRS